MPELWEKSQDGVNRKLREKWAKDPNNVKRKLRELWAKDNNGVNRKIFSGGIHWNYSIVPETPADWIVCRATDTHTFEGKMNQYSSDIVNIEYDFDSIFTLPANSAITVQLNFPDCVHDWVFNLAVNGDSAYSWQLFNYIAVNNSYTINLQSAVKVSNIKMSAILNTGGYISPLAYAIVTLNSAEYGSFLLNNSGQFNPN